MLQQQQFFGRRGSESNSIRSEWTGSAPQCWHSFLMPHASFGVLLQSIYTQEMGVLGLPKPVSTD